MIERVIQCLLVGAFFGVMIAAVVLGWAPRDTPGVLFLMAWAAIFGLIVQELLTEPPPW